MEKTNNMKSEIALLKQGGEVTVNAKDYKLIQSYCDNQGMELVVTKSKNVIKIKLK